MRTNIAFLLCMVLSLLSACASGPRRVPTFEEAVKETPNLESGIYNRTNGENVQVTVTSLKARIEELEKQLTDARKEGEFYKRTNEELKYENIGLRARGNYQLTEERPVVKGFDEKHNAIVEKTEVNREPAKVEDRK